MNEQSPIENRRSKIAEPESPIVIVGAGPAGASLAIRLARAGFAVVLAEREKFPRHKLCGEFVSPECLTHFAELGVLGEMLAAGGDRIGETIFYAPNGRRVGVPSEWLGGAAVGGALGISRAEMDFRLLERARAVGVEVLEETSAVGLSIENGEVRGVRLRGRDGATRELSAALTIDATGRANVLGTLLRKSGKIETNAPPRAAAAAGARLVGFKTHLENVALAPGVCEIYFFRGGYGGLSYVEDGRANHCFLARADLVKRYIGQTNLLVEEVIFANRRARATMRDARPLFDWLAVAVDSFGLKTPRPAPNLLTVGDAAAFIDPFTGSGMLMALDGARLLAEILAARPATAAEAAAVYDSEFRRRFRKRLRVCALMRRAAFVPHLAGAVVSALSLSRAAREMLARATRGAGIIKKSNTKI